MLSGFALQRIFSHFAPDIKQDGWSINTTFAPRYIMKHLKALNKYFWKYRWRLGAGIFFVIISNYFAILAPQVAGYVVDKVQQLLPGGSARPVPRQNDFLVNAFIDWMDKGQWSFGNIVILSGLVILVLAIIRGIFMFFMRQTLVVMSRYIEYDQKNEVYRHYQQLDTHFFKIHSTGDLMNRIAEDVSRVRMYTGPAIMYLVNLTAVIVFAVSNMLAKNVTLTLYVLAPLPLLAATIYYVNTIIHKKSEAIQGLLSDLTTNAQQSYSGIRVIKSYVQEKAMFAFFKDNTEEYRKKAIGLAKVEAIYAPSIVLLIGISTIITIMMGAIYFLNGRITEVGIIVEFVLYINMLTFPVSAIGWVASMIQRAAASQKRLNEFLDTKPEIQDLSVSKKNGTTSLKGGIQFDKVSFTFPHTGIKAIRSFTVNIQPGQKIAVVGRTGSGKSTLSALLLRLYNIDSGTLLLDGIPIQDIPLHQLRRQISYVPQDVFLFSDTIASNIRFGNEKADEDAVKNAAKSAVIHAEIEDFPKGYETMVGERGVTLSGGQKQRISIARALLKEAPIVIFDDCLSAVDATTEKKILQHLNEELRDKTAIIITHRIFSLLEFDHILVMEDGSILEEGTHAQLMAKNGEYAAMYNRQREPLQEENDRL